MLGSLRFRLTAVILAVVLVFGLVSIGLAVRLFQDVTRQQSVDELRREASGLAALYAESAIRSSDEGAKAPEFAAEKLELATGDELYYIGASLFPGQRFGLTRLPRNALGDIELARDEQIVVEFTPPGESRRLLAVAQPVQLVQGTEPFGWLIVAKPEAELREQWVSLLGRLALALAVGVALAGLLFLWLSRRLTEPVRALTRATEQVAAGRYDVEIPEPRGRDEIALLSERFRGMVAQLAEAEQLKRSFLMSVSHELRTPLTAIRGHVEAIREGIVSEPDQVRVSLDIVAAETDRLERLVGDVLDLAKLQAHRFTVRHEEVDARAPARPGVRCVHRGGAASGDRLLALGRGRGARHRVRRRSRSAGDHEPPRERLPVDAGRRADRAASRHRERRRLGRRRRFRAGRACVAAQEDLRGVRLPGCRGHWPRPSDRPRARGGARRWARARLECRYGEPVQARIAGVTGALVALLSSQAAAACSSSRSGTSACPSGSTADSTMSPRSARCRGARSRGARGVRRRRASPS